MSWRQAFLSAFYAAHYTGRRFRVYRDTYTNGRTLWCYEPVNGWTP